MEKDELNPRQMKFVEGIEAGLCLAAAYRGAGYEAQGHSVYSQASRLVRNDKVIEELDRRMLGRKRAAEQRFASMVDGATNVYIKILKLDPGTNEKLMELQRKVASDVFDRIGLKPADKLEHRGAMDHQVSFLDVLRLRRQQREQGD